MGGYEPYPAYKDSGVEWLGDIPEGWGVIALKRLFKIKKQIAGKLGYDVLSVTQKGIKIKDIESGEGQLAMDYSKYQMVRMDDYVMNHMDLLTGYIDVSKYEGVTSPDYRVFHLTNSAAVGEFYLHLFQLGYKNRIFFPLAVGPRIWDAGVCRQRLFKALQFHMHLPTNKPRSPPSSTTRPRRSTASSRSRRS